MITMTKKALREVGRARVSEKWITNGHWAIQRKHVRNSAMFNSPETRVLFDNTIDWNDLPEQSAKQCLEDPPRELEWKFTGIAHVRSGEIGSKLPDLLEYENEKGEKAYFNRDYVEFLAGRGSDIGADMSVLKGNDAFGSFEDSKGIVVLMAVRKSEKEEKK